jgi:hypothetical protein
MSPKPKRTVVKAEPADGRRSKQPKKAKKEEAR